MRYVFALCLICGASAAPAHDITTVFNDQDQQTLVQALDALMKTQGLTSLTNGTAAAVQAVFQKLQAAAQAPDPKPTELPK